MIQPHIDNDSDQKCDECSYTTAMRGDVNGDGKLDTRDARLVLRYYVGDIADNEINLSACDINSDGKIDTRDARLILIAYIEG